MKYLSQEEIKESQLAILDVFVKICSEHNLQYFLCGGTLLGAIRHQGFIPWDDDIDVFMPRPDFEKFLKLTFAKPYEIDFYRNGKGARPFIKLLDTSIIASEKNTTRSGFLWVDIFPIDGLFKNTVLNKYHFKIVLFLRKGVYFGFRPKTGFIGKILLFLLNKVKIHPKKVNVFFSLLVDQLSKIKQYEKSSYVGGIAWGYGPQERMLRKDMEQACEVIFEGKKYLAPAIYHQYLKNLYGNYMELPPEEKRKNHGLLAWRTLEKEVS